MSSVQLLDKTRKIGRLLHNNNSSKVVFNDICSVMRDILDSSVIVISRKGKLLGQGLLPGEEPITELIGGNVGEFIDKMLNERLLSVLSTKENVNLDTLGFEKTDTRVYRAIVTPIEIAGRKRGKRGGDQEDRGGQIGNEHIVIFRDGGHSAYLRRAPGQ